MTAIMGTTREVVDVGAAPVIRVTAMQTHNLDERLSCRFYGCKGSHLCTSKAQNMLQTTRMPSKSPRYEEMTVFFL